MNLETQQDRKGDLGEKHEDSKYAENANYVGADDKNHYKMDDVQTQIQLIQQYRSELKLTED